MNRSDHPFEWARAACLLVLVLLVAGCSGDGPSTTAQKSGDPMDDLQADGEVGAEGGTVVGEFVEVTVPEGAVPEGQTALISVEGTPPPATGRAAAFGSASLGAIQVTSSVPLLKEVVCTVILSDDVTDETGAITTPLVFAVTAQADGGVSAPGGQCMSADGNSGDATLTFECDPSPEGAPATISFIESSVEAHGTVARAVLAQNEGGGGGPVVVGPGDGINGELNLFQDPSVALDGSSANVWANGTATAVGGSGLVPPYTALGAFELDGVSRVNDITNLASWRSSNVPVAKVSNPPAIQITLNPDTVLMMGGAGGGVVQLGDEYCFKYNTFVYRTEHGAGGEPGLPPPPLPDDATLEDLPEADGVYIVDGELSFPDGAQGQGNGPAPLLCTVAYKDGVVIADLTSGTVLNTLDFLQDSPLGSVPLSFVPPSPGTRGDALLSFYNDGYGITHYDPASGAYGFTQIDPQSGSVSDVNRYEEDAGYAVLVQSGGNRVRFVEPNTDAVPGQTFFQVVGTNTKQIASSLFAGATGSVITAARRSGTSPVYFVTVGASPTAAGSLWRKNDPADFSTPATLVGSVGAFPRRLRFAGTVGAVSNSEADTLTILARDASDNVTIKGTVDVGDQPIGIDLLVLPNGNIGVLSTGFSDHTYTVTILEPDGDVVSSETLPVPGGGLNPAHAVWANAEGTRIAVSCFGSDEVRIFSIG